MLDDEDSTKGVKKIIEKVKKSTYCKDYLSLIFVSLTIMMLQFSNNSFISSKRACNLGTARHLFAHAFQYQSVHVLYKACIYGNNQSTRMTV